MGTFVAETDSESEMIMADETGEVRLAKGKKNRKPGLDSMASARTRNAVNIPSGVLFAEKQQFRSFRCGKVIIC